jgi:dipeptidyl aminopeptidase/acylaminoacyl peptidase
VTETRTLEDGKTWLLERLERGVHPVDEVDPDVARETIESLEGLDPERWTTAWGSAAERFAADAERASDDAAARDAWLQAYRFAFLARYPTLNDPLKRDWYERTREYFVKARSLDHPPLEVVTVPFEGRDGEGREIHFYVARPQGAKRPPVVMTWGGIDTWKEEMRSRVGSFLERGFAMLLVDMPGIGQSPVLAGRDSERQWTPVFDWLEEQSDLDAARVATLGASYGGYWAMKLAYTHRERLRAAVNWGGGVHITFTREWQEQSRNASSYLMDLMAARAAIFGGKTFEDYVARCPELSLLDQGLLDQPSAPILLVNGRHDLQNATDDIYLSLEHGDPKTARIFPGGHMGEGPTVPTIADWLAKRLTE